MTDSLLRTRYRQPAPPIDRTTTDETWASYRKALAEIGSKPDGMERLSALLTEVSTALQLQTRDQISSTLSAYSATQDRPVQRSMPRVAPSPGRPDPRPEPSRQPAAWELLSSSRRLGPRLAAKLTIASARAESKRNA